MRLVKSTVAPVDEEWDRLLLAARGNAHVAQVLADGLKRRSTREEIAILLALRLVQLANRSTCPNIG